MNRTPLVIEVPAPRRKRMLAFLNVKGPTSVKALAAFFGASVEVMRTEIGALKRQGNVRVVKCERCGSHDLVEFVRMARFRGSVTRTQAGR